MSYLTDWLTILFICSIVIMSPGPNLVITLRNSLIHTQKAGILTALGLAVGDLIHIGFWLIGIGWLIARSLWLFNLVKWVGAAYLVYLGIRSLQARGSGKNPLVEAGRMQRVASPAISPKQAFRMGLLTCLLNPKVSLFFLALFTQLIRPNTPIAVQLFYGITVASVEFGWFATVAIALSRPWIKRRLLSVAHWVDRVMGVVLIGLGLRLALSRE